MYSKYMTGTDFSRMPYTDSMQRNPLYEGAQLTSPAMSRSSAKFMPGRAESIQDPWESQYRLAENSYGSIASAARYSPPHSGQWPASATPPLKAPWRAAARI